MAALAARMRRRLWCLRLRRCSIPAPASDWHVTNILKVDPKAGISKKPSKTRRIQRRIASRAQNHETGKWLLVHGAFPANAVQLDNTEWISKCNRLPTDVQGSFVSCPGRQRDPVHFNGSPRFCWRIIYSSHVQKVTKHLCSMITISTPSKPLELFWNKEATRIPRILIISIKIKIPFAFEEPLL